LYRHQWISASDSSTWIRRGNCKAAVLTKAGIPGVDLGHIHAYNDIGIGNWLNVLSAACVPRANYDHHIVKQVLRIWVRLCSARDTLLINLFTDVLIGGTGKRLGQNNRATTEEKQSCDEFQFHLIARPFRQITAFGATHSDRQADLSD